MDILERLAEIDKGATHWEGCEESHIRCAARREIESLRAQVARLESQLSAARGEADFNATRAAEFEAALRDQGEG